MKRFDNKYGARKTVVGGRKFDSIGEARRWGQLLFMERAGKIMGLTCQPVVVLMNARVKRNSITYKPDFYYWDNKRCEDVWEDFKGVETGRFRLVKKIWRFHGPGRLLVTKANGEWYDILPDERI